MATDQATQLQTITDEVEKWYQAMQSSAQSISGLLQLGSATCDEVKAYNLWALAVYNTQIGMLNALRTGGEQNIPDDPALPPLFGWKDTQGEDTWQIDCSSEPQSLSGAMSQALKGPTTTTQFLSADQIEVVTSYDPSKGPSYQTLLAVQQARVQQALGTFGVLIVIAGISIAVSIAIAAIMDYLDANAVQEDNTQQTRLQAEAFATFTAARLACYANCAQSGRTPDDCSTSCMKLVAPDINIPSSGWSTLQWVGVAAVAAGAVAGIVYVVHKILEHHKESQQLIELPANAHEAHLGYLASADPRDSLRPGMREAGATMYAKEMSKLAKKSNTLKAHRDAAEAHLMAAELHRKSGMESMAKSHEKSAAKHERTIQLLPQ